MYVTFTAYISYIVFSAFNGILISSVIYSFSNFFQGWSSTA